MIPKTTRLERTIRIATMLGLVSLLAAGATHAGLRLQEAYSSDGPSAYEKLSPGITAFSSDGEAFV